MATLDKTYRSPGGVVVFDGTSISQPVNFSSVTYPLTFTETGLPPGTNWSVTFRGIPVGSASATIVAPESNGTCPYTIGAPPGWTTPAFSGAIVVAGSPVNETVPWSVTTYSVEFVENDLPGGTNWSVSLGGDARSSTQSSIEFTEANGTYSYRVGIVPGWATSRYGGTIPVRGADLSEVFHWAPVTYTAAFSESGLPAGTRWSVTFDGVVGSGTLPFLAFVGIPNGTYELRSVRSRATRRPRGTGRSWSGGLQASEAIVFSTGSATFLGVPATEGYEALGGILAAIVVGSAALVYWVRREEPPARPSRDRVETFPHHPLPSRGPAKFRS